MKIVVWHHQAELARVRGMEKQYRELFSGFIKPASGLWEAGCFMPVAVIDVPNSTKPAEACEVAWSQTQNLELPWTKTALAPLGDRCQPLLQAARSSMVGDVFEAIYPDGGEGRSLWVCAAVGFKPLGVV
jgi:hypothetical protein